MEKEINAARKELSSAIRAFFETVEEYNISRDEKNALFDHQQFAYETDSKVAAILPDGGAAYFETLRSLKTRETFYFSLISQYSNVLEQEKTEPITLHILFLATWKSPKLQGFFPSTWVGIFLTLLFA